MCSYATRVEETNVSKLRGDDDNARNQGMFRLLCFDSMFRKNSLRRSELRTGQAGWSHRLRLSSSSQSPFIQFLLSDFISKKDKPGGVALSPLAPGFRVPGSRFAVAASVFLESARRPHQLLDCSTCVPRTTESLITTSSDLWISLALPILEQDHQLFFEASLLAASLRISSSSLDSRSRNGLSGGSFAINRLASRNVSEVPSLLNKLRHSTLALCSLMMSSFTLDCRSRRSGV